VAAASCSTPAHTLASWAITNSDRSDDRLDNPAHPFRGKVRRRERNGGIVFEVSTSAVNPHTLDTKSTVDV